MQKLRVFVASPSDMAVERARVEFIALSLKPLADSLDIVLEVIDWSSVVPDMGRPEQVILDQVKPTSWDIFIGILWHRFGTPTGGKDKGTKQEYLSGTEEEFKTAYRLWQNYQRPRIMMYRCKRNIPQGALDPAQFKLIQNFFDQFDGKKGEHPGIYQTFDTTKSFEMLLNNNIQKLLIEYGENLKNIDKSSPNQNLYISPKTYHRLIGRLDELDKIMSALRQRDRKPIVAVVGLGGIGKTALVHEIEERCRQENLFDYIVGASSKTEHFINERIVHSDGIIIDFDSLLGDIARQCNQTEIANLPFEQKKFSVAHFLMDNRVLVILDNLETVPSREELVKQVFEILGRSKLLITSRHKVELHDNIFELKVSGLSPDESISLLREEGRERNITAVSEAEFSDLTAIHEATGGIPLAIKLVVGQMSRQPMEIVLGNLKRVTVKAEDEKLYRFIYWDSWNLLEENSRIALVDMSVFPPNTGGAAKDIEMISKLTPDVFWPAMDQLVRMSLVDKTGIAGKERYALHTLTYNFILSDITEEGQNNYEES